MLGLGPNCSQVLINFTFSTRTGSELLDHRKRLLDTQFRRRCESKNSRFVCRQRRFGQTPEQFHTADQRRFQGVGRNGWRSTEIRAFDQQSKQQFRRAESEPNQYDRPDGHQPFALSEHRQSGQWKPDQCNKQ